MTIISSQDEIEKIKAQEGEEDGDDQEFAIVVDDAEENHKNK